MVRGLERLCCIGEGDSEESDVSGEAYLDRFGVLFEAVVSCVCLFNGGNGLSSSSSSSPHIASVIVEFCGFLVMAIVDFW